MAGSKTLTVVAVVAVVVAGCGGHDGGQAPTTTVDGHQPVASAPPTSVTHPPPIASNVVGPVFYKCDGGLDFRKLDIASGEFTPVVSYSKFDCNDIPDPKLPFSTGNFGVYNGNTEFGGQLSRLSFSPNYQKVAISSNGLPSNHVGYYDRELGGHGDVVDVTQWITPPLGDFDTEPRNSGGWFTANGYFVFHDDVADKYVAVDTDTKKEVSLESAKVPAWVDSAIGPSSSGQYRAKTCGSGVWVVDGKRYLQLVEPTISAPPETFIRMADITDQPDSPSCVNQNGNDTTNRLTPITNIRNGGVASDPTGVTIIFTFVNRDNVSKIFKANVADPDHPIELPVRIPPDIQNVRGLTPGIYNWEIVDWS